MKKLKGKDLIFISQIMGDGLSVDKINKSMNIWDNEVFTLTRLSILKDTWIAQSMFTFVVKIK